MIVYTTYRKWQMSRRHADRLFDCSRWMSIILLILLAACDNDLPANDQKSEKSVPLQVKDFSDETITLTKPAERIIALAPHIVENVFTAGAGDKLVGVVQYSNYPEQANSLPIVGGYEKTNLERVLALNPDLIIGWQSGNSHGSLNRLKELGFSVYIDQPDSLKDVAKSISDIGILSGTSAVARPAAQNYLRSLEEIQMAYQDKIKISSFYQVWNSPLQTISGGHIISGAIEICGGVNVYANEFAVAPIINIESLLERDPMAIIASGMSSARPDWLDDWLEWPSLRAVQAGNLFYVNPDHIQRHTIRLMSGIESICAQLDTAREKLISKKVGDE